MLTVVLPGYSEKNKTWAYETKENLGENFNVSVVEWAHWTSGQEMDMPAEVAKIVALVGTAQVNFIAKSVGTQVLMQVLPKIKNQVNKIILCGIPVNPLSHLNGLSAIPSENILVIQNSQDPFMSHAIIEKYIHLLNKDIKVLKKESDTHDYPYWEEFKEFVSSV